ncbi:MAG: hypothetical protein GC152_04130 [Alphaproteobacteria bacterium]|nr:hypothetical protein [Alphaproteobacteria bacterium]
MDSFFSSPANVETVLYVLAPVIAALLTGVAIGWFIWGGERSDDAALGRIRARSGEPDGAIDPTSRLAELETELGRARELLKKNASRQDALATDLSAVDKAVKRAAGRVALVMRGLKA